ncbi:MAG: hypothetical protein KDK89_16715 [Alphaproteobacteria bacterium]|nr:hypothetical protein [Alphaproteobacteria bacterium]
MKLKVVAVFAIAFVMGGCQTAEKPPRYPKDPPKTKSEWCLLGGKLLGDPYLSDWQKLSIYEKLRNRGCLR